MRARLLCLLTAATAMAAPSVPWSNVPLSFEPNTGQANKEVRYLARGSNYTLLLTGRETVVAARNQPPLRMSFAGGNPSAPMAAEASQRSTSNYFVGNDPTKWRTAVPNYARVRYSGIYPGIDLVYYGREGTLEYDWIVAPGADPGKIRITFEGRPDLRIDGQGDLVIRQGGNEYRHKKPAIYQEIAGKRTAVDGLWVVRGSECSFQIGVYDHTRTLTIDPPLVFATYEGGNLADYAYAVAVDAAGNTYVAGGTGSSNFSTSGALQGALKGVEDVSVTKINSDGSSKIFSTFLGGGGPDEGKGIAVDNEQNVYITGSAGSFDFPMKNPIQGTWGGSGDAFLTKLDPSGALLVYSTYLGGNAIDYATAVATDPVGNAYIVGVTFSANFPTVNPFQAAKGAQQDAFVAKANPDGSAWVYCTYLGGNAVDEGYAIAADSNGNAYVTGYTGSSNFPLQSPLRSSNSNSVDAFITKLNPAGSALVFSTYLGGTATDYGTGIVVDASGNVYVAGVAGSKDFPVVNAMQPKLAGADDAFIAKLSANGSGLIYSTYLGGGSEDQAYGLAIDQAGNAYVTGRTNSSDFPLTDPVQAGRFAFDMFVAELSADGSARLFSTFVGGTGSESGRGIAVDRAGNIHVVGEGSSTDLPLVRPIQASYGGGAEDGIVLLFGKLIPPPPAPDITIVSDNLVSGGAIVPGGWFYVKGANLADVTRIWGPSDFTNGNNLPTNLSGVEVLINGVPAPVYFISPAQVNAQAPQDVSGSITVQVSHDGQLSNILTVPVAQIDPSVYYYTVNGKNFAAALFVDYTVVGDPAVVPGTHKAKPGDIIQLYASGLGPSPSGVTITNPIPITGVGVKIGDTNASVLAADFVAAGQYQVNFTVPQVADGEYAITVSASGKTSPANVFFDIGH
ncbi:MAG TPA: SBBP repeat-containing protein [Bryobacteraceae bacterium]|nr:SBBP repeat-containing protein [Bryobacteraceae bacterium]